ncbi:NAD(P)-dependent oxidoreductase [Streptomyces sp. NPDC057654]|uniref:NAD(P)-dependent oxidoreductase n=1 Tax=Streptomyces sp. NPDC057654 TaxID=3346196 RepID=UPI0036D032EA
MSHKTTRVGFLGRGVMGGPMARNLLKAGFEVTGYSGDETDMDALTAAGGCRAASVAGAVQDADTVITLLHDSSDVRTVVLGDDGVLANAREGALLIECSTVHPEVSRALAAAAAGKGVRILEAPVSGGEQPAVEGTLTIIAGGDAATLDAARPVLRALGDTVVHVGPIGAGQAVKAANRLIVAGTIELIAESLVLLEAQGADTSAAIDVLAHGLAGSRILDRKAAAMARREFTAGFPVDLHHKDLGIVQDAARESGVALPLGTVVAQLMAVLKAQGHGALDHGALLKVVEQLSGRAGG